MTTFVKTWLRSKVMRVRYPAFSSRVPVALKEWQRIQTEAGGCEDVLLPVELRPGEIGYSGEQPELVNVFAGVELGTWAINGKTIDLLWRYMDEKRPKIVLEFGSGSSTCVFAEWFKCNDPTGRVISIDQNDWAAKETKDRLTKFGLAEYVNVMVMQLDAADQYVVDLGLIKKTLGGKTVDVVFADGPCGRSGCRSNTLPSVLPCLSDYAVWFLHDSLRTAEMAICDAWSKIPGVSVHGIVPLGNGIAVGQWQKL